MKSLGQALKQLIIDLKIEDKVLYHQAISLWPEIVGKRIAQVSHAERIEKSILFVKVTNDSWRNDLIYLKRDIIEKFNKRLGKRIIEDIRLY